MQPIKFKNRLTTIVSLLLIIGFLTTSLVSYFISITSLRDNIIFNELPLTSDNIYSEIQRDLLKPIFISSLMSNDTFLRDWVINGEEDTQAITNYLREIKQKYHTFTAFFVSELTHNYYHLDGVMKQVHPDETRDAWYFRVKQMDGDYEINVDIDMANEDALTIFVNYRVYDYQGNFIGVTGVGLQVDAVKTIINRYQTTYKRNIFFIDENAKVQFSHHNDANSPAYLKRLLESPYKQRLMEKIKAQEASSFEYEIGNQQVLFNTRYIKEFNWYLNVTQNRIDGQEQLLNTLWLNIAVCLAITLIVLFITRFTLRSYQQDIEQLATIDKLTGLYNRQALDIIFTQWITEQKRHPSGLAVILFDIDHFKSINDHYGHLAGDEVLTQVASRTRSRLRASDVIGRWGGEEFLVLIKNIDLETAVNMAKELQQILAKNAPLYDQQTIPTEISAGVGLYQPGDSVESLTARVDKALYAAKKGGRNQVKTG